MKNKTIKKLVIGSTILMIVIPFFINLAFKIHIVDILSAEWSAGDFLAFYGSVLGGILSMVGVFFTLSYQAKQARKDDDVKYKPIVRLDSVTNNYEGLLGRREVEVDFPLILSNDDILRYQKHSLFDAQMEDKSCFHFLFKNKGRGEATNVLLDDIKIKEVSWDEETHLYTALSTPVSLGEILVNDSVVVTVMFPRFLFMDKNRDYNVVRIELSISYDDMFHRNKRKISWLSDFEVIKIAEAPAPYFYKERFDYYNVKVNFLEMMQTEEIVGH